MRVFQIIHKYGPYIPHFESKYSLSEKNYEEHRRLLIQDRFYSPHILKPALNNEKNGFYTMWNNSSLQIKWAKERGWNETDIKKILFAQIEDFKPDVFYNCSPIYFNRNEIKKINCAKKIAWFASPEKQKIDFSIYNARLTNYPPDLMSISDVGFRTEMFQPSVDPIMEVVSKSNERPIDIFVYGQYFAGSFKTRNKFIDKLVKFKESSKWNIKLGLQYDTHFKSLLPDIVPTRIRNSRYTSCLRDKSTIIFPEEIIRNNSVKPFYGIDLYNEISKSKIVFNAAVDFSGEYKVNMRNIETLGCGAHMISDDGIYPEGLTKGHDFSVYNSFEDFIEKANYFLNNPIESRKIAEQGQKTVFQKFSKEEQWTRFKKIVQQV